MSTAATLSSGKKLPGPKALAAHLERVQRLSRGHSRKQPGSHKRRKSALRLARLHARIPNLRQDWSHQTTTRLVRKFSVMGIKASSENQFTCDVHPSQSGQQLIARAVEAAYTAARQAKQ